MGIAAQCLFSMPRTTAIAPRPFAYLSAAFGRPLVAVLPAVMAMAVFWHRALSIGATVAVGVTVLTVALIFIGYVNLMPEEREIGYNTAQASFRRLRNLVAREGRM